MTTVFMRPRTIAAGIAAGILGGILIVACIAVMSVSVLHDANFTVARFFQYIASVLVHQQAYTASVYVGLGIVLHFLVSIGWAVGYGYMAERQEQLVTRPLTSGAAFGLVVYFAMQLVIVAGNMYRTPTPAQLGVSLLAHIVFFGIPVAVVVSRALRAR